jgi:hypothetical protein
MIPLSTGFPRADPHKKSSTRACEKAVEKLGIEACNRRKSIAFVQTAPLCVRKIFNNISELLE